LAAPGERDSGEDDADSGGELQGDRLGQNEGAEDDSDDG
jgi:hypothetical protein